MKHTHRILGLIAASLIGSAVLYGQSAQVIYEQDQNFPGVTTVFRSPWFGGNLGSGSFMPDPTGRIISTNDFYAQQRSFACACRTSRAATHSSGLRWLQATASGARVARSITYPATAPTA